LISDRLDRLRDDTPNANADPTPATGFPRRGVLVGALVAVALTAAHVYARLQPAGYTGPVIAADNAFSVALALALLSVCAAVGRRVLRRWGLAFEHAADELAFATAAGAAFVSASILALGLLAALRPAALAVLFLGWAVFGRRELASLPKLVARAVGSVKARTGDGVYWALAVAVLGLVVGVFIVQTVAPPTDWDSLMYHLQVPRRFLEAGRVFVPEDNLHVAFVGLAQMLYVPLLAAKSPAAAAVLSALFALLLGTAVFSLAARFFDGAAAAVALVTLWASTSVLLVAITPRVDVTLAFYVFLAHYALLLALKEPARLSWLYAAAFLLGSAVGVKYHALAYSAALAPLVLWIALANRRRVRGAIPVVGVFALVAAAAAGPWLAKNWLLLGAPFYPFLTDRMLPPWLTSLYGGTSVPGGVDAGIFRAIAQARRPFNLVHLFVAPGLLTVEQEGVFYHMNLLYPLLPFTVLFFRNKTLAWVVLPPIAYLLIVILPFPTTNLRYLIPAFAPLTIAVAYVAVRLANRFLSADAARLLIIAAAALALFPSGKAMYFWLRKSDVLGYLVGATSQAEYLDTGFTFYSRLVRATNERVPPDGKVLLLFEARGYYFEPAVIQDNVLTNWPLLAPKAVADPECLRSTGITHVLFSGIALRYYALRGTDPAVFRIDLLNEFAARCLAVVQQGGGFTLLRLLAEPRPPAGREPGPS
jgi:hypothetical protein